MRRPLIYISHIVSLFPLDADAVIQAARRDLQFSESLARRLQLERVLTGHSSCVNRLSWNVEGTKLASTSDDRQVMLWPYPDSEKLPIQIETEHHANIFGVKILPSTDNQQVVTGSMDNLVQLHTLEARPAFPRPVIPSDTTRGSGPVELAIVSSRSHTQTFACHKGRVKDVEVRQRDPHLFWSASEDGTVRQFDVRLSHQDTHESSNVLVSVRHNARPIQLKGLSINKACPHQLAVACSDPYIRIYDVRKLSTRPPSDTLNSPALLELAPPHMQKRALSFEVQPHATYVSFGNRGDKVVATYHGDHAYTFDTTGSATSYSSAFLIRPINSIVGNQATSMQQWKYNGNCALFEKDYDRAVWHYSRGLQLAPASTSLLISRASAYIQRQWEGDASFALLDAEAALSLDPTLARAHLLRCQALLGLRHLRLASQAADVFVRLFPDQKKGEIIRVRETLEEELEAARKARIHRRLMRERKQQRRQRIAAERAQQRLDAEARSGVDTGDGAVRGRRRFMTTMVDTEESETDETDSDDPGDEESTEASSANVLSLDHPWSRQESLWNQTPGGCRLMNRYVGQCNIQTDIKEATFLGDDDRLVACGSDDGRIFIFHTESGTLVRALEADEDVANCVQCHPSQAVLATSGIERTIKLWSPGSKSDSSDLSRLVKLNQARMKDGPHWYPRAAFQTAMRTHVLQTLSENPDLIPELRSLLISQAQRGGTGLEDEISLAALAANEDPPRNVDEPSGPGTTSMAAAEPEAVPSEAEANQEGGEGDDELDFDLDQENNFINCVVS